MKKIFKEFKEFISRGNVVDMAVGVIIGGAFGKIVTSLVNDIIMPLIALIANESDIAGLGVVLNGVDKYVTNEAGDLVLNEAAIILSWGNLLQVVIDFLLIAIILFIIIKVANIVHHRLHKKEEEAAKKAAEEAALKAEEEAKLPTKTEALLMEIRDLLIKKEN